MEWNKKLFKLIVGGVIVAVVIAIIWVFYNKKNTIADNEEELKGKISNLIDELTSCEDDYNAGKSGLKPSATLSRTIQLINSDKQALGKMSSDDTAFLSTIRRHISDFKKDFKKDTKTEEESCDVLTDSTKLRLENERGEKMGTKVTFKIKKTLGGCHTITVKLITKEDNKEDVIKQYKKQIRGIEFKSVTFNVNRTKDREFYLELVTNERKTATIPVQY